MGDRATDESEWVSVHAFYHDDLDRLVINVIGPLAHGLAERGLARDFFFIRYWEGGPHIRLRVLPFEQTRRAEVEELVTGRFLEYFTGDPAADGMSQEEYARSARLLAERENVSSYAERLYPNNSVMFVPYRREHDRYGYGPAIQAVERHFTESSRIALRVLTKGATAKQRVTAAAALILLAWFVGCPDAERLRARLDSPGVHVNNETVVLARQMHALAAEAGTLPTGGTLVDWARSVAGLRGTLADHLSGAQATRALDLCAHLICNRLGVSVFTEGAVREAAAEAVAVLAGKPHWSTEGG